MQMGTLQITHFTFQLELLTTKGIPSERKGLTRHLVKCNVCLQTLFHNRSTLHQPRAAFILGATSGIFFPFQLLQAAQQLED